MKPEPAAIAEGIRAPVPQSEVRQFWFANRGLSRLVYVSVVAVQPLVVEGRPTVGSFESRVVTQITKTVKLTFLMDSSRTLRLVLIASVLAAACSAAAGQIPRPTVDPLSSISAEKSSPGSPDQTGNSMAEEMRIKREIKSAEKDHQQNLDRAKEASELGQALVGSFKKNNSLAREDLKKLEKLEKLAKRIRSEAGGSEDEVSLEKKPSDLQEAMNCVGEVSASLNEKVQETPRQVVSATIIDKANVLLELIRVVRTFSLGTAH